MGSVCSRCGAEIKHVFRVGSFLFGSECVGKVDDELMRRLYGERLELGRAIQMFVEQRMKSRARGVARDVTIDVDAIPAIGQSVKWKTSHPQARALEVVGYGRNGIRLKGSQVYNGIGREFFNDAPFDRAADLIVVETESSYP